MESFDTDKDGTWSEQEWTLYKANQKLESELRKQRKQGWMAWAALVAMFIFTAMLFTPWVTIERLDSLASMSDLFYVAQAGIVGAYVGVSTWMNGR